MGSKIGTLKVAAKRIGMSFEDYLKKIDDGFKWCTKCKSWKPIGMFYQDTSRGSGKKSICKDCDYQRKTPGPTKAEKRDRAIIGLGWCNHCQSWLPLNEIKRGICKPCKRKSDRLRYATDSNHRAKMRQRIHSRKRKVDPIPPEGQEFILSFTNGKCAYCGKPATTWDHIMPISKGGRTTPGNIVPACVSCNSSKNNRDVDEWIIKNGIEPNSEFFNTLILSEAGLWG